MATDNGRAAPAKKATPPSSTANSQAATGHPTEGGWRLLLAALRGVQPRPAPHPSWVAFCPCHDDVGTEPSLGIDYKQSNLYGEGRRLLVGCRTCGANGLDVCNELGLPAQHVLFENRELD